MCRSDPFAFLFTDVLFFRGTLQQPVLAYTIKVYDLQHNLLKTTNGTPSGSTIDDSWDFTADGTHVDSGLDAEISFPLDSQVPQPVVKHYSMERCFNNNSFTLGWGWDYGNSTQLATRGQYVRYGLVDMLGSDLNGLEFDLLPAGNGGNVPSTSSFQLDGSQVAHDRFLASIADPDSVNFFFWGHGFDEGISWSRSPAGRLTYREIANVTGNPGGTNMPDNVYRHAYRFVFMDACGAYSSKMIRAFGIPFSRNGSTFTVAEWVQWHLTPRAFVGWNVSVVGSDPVDPSGLSDLYRVTAQQIVLGYWQAGASLKDAMAAWDAYLPDKRWWRYGTTYSQVDPNADDPSNPGHKVGIYPPMKSWKISGCRDLNRYSPFP